MGHRLRNLIIILCIGIISAATSALLLQLNILDRLEAIACGFIAFAIMLVIHNSISLQRHFQRVEKHFRSAHQFERNISSRLQLLESEIPTTDQTKDGDEAIAVGAGVEPGEFGDNYTPGLLSEISKNREARGKITSTPAYEDNDNVIPLNTLIERTDKLANNNTKPFKIKPSQLAKVLEKGGTELFLQPILEIPSRNIRYFEAFVRIRIADNILTAKQFLPAAKNSGQIAQIDLLSLGLTFKVVRGLQRRDNEYSVFWNISPQILGNKSAFKELLEQLRANQPLNRQLICEIPHAAYVKLNTVQSDNLSRIRDLGYELSLDKVAAQYGDKSSIEAIVKNGMFAFIKIPAVELMRIDKDDLSNFAASIVPLTNRHGTTLIASEVESDAQCVSIIDADIYLAQGDALMPAKALKKELGGV